MPSSMKRNHRKAISDGMKRHWEAKRRNEDLAHLVVEEARKLVRDTDVADLARAMSELPLKPLVDAVQELEDALAGS